MKDLIDRGTRAFDIYGTVLLTLIRLMKNTTGFNLIFFAVLFILALAGLSKAAIFVLGEAGGEHSSPCSSCSPASQSSAPPPDLRADPEVVRPRSPRALLSGSD